MQAEWIVAVFKTDKRCRSGQRLLERFVFASMLREQVDSELQELALQFPQRIGQYRFEVYAR